MNQPLVFLQNLILLAVALSFFIHMAAERWTSKPPPKRLLNTAQRITQGKVPVRIANQLKVKVLGFTEHYRRVPGRLSCRITPYNKNGEKVWAYVIGLKETADSDPHRFVVIPVYGNGSIYDL